VTVVGTSPTGPAIPRAARWPGWLTAAGMATLVLPFVAIAVLVLKRPWSPSTDLAVMELRIRDVGGPATPLVGPYSRFGWHHPGPLAFWVLALPYRLAGARPVGLLLGTAAVHAAATAGCLVLAHRRGGRALAALTAFTVAALLAGLGAGTLVNFWNPYLPLLALVFLVLAAWSVVEGDLGLLPVVVGVACFAWQSHVSYLAVTAALTAVAVAGAVLKGWGRPRRLLVVGGATAVTAALCLAPVVVEQYGGHPGNLARIVESVRQPPMPPIGGDRATAILAAQLSPVGPWVRGGERDAPLHQEGTPADEAPRPLLAVPVVALIVVSGLAARAGAWSAVRFLGLAALTVAMGAMTAAAMAGAPFEYLLTWLRSVAAVVWLALAWGLVCVVRDRRPLSGPGLAVAGAALASATAVAAVTAVAGGPRLSLPWDKPSVPLQVLGPATVAAVAGQPEVRMAMAGGWCAGELGTGLAAHLEEHGTAAVFDAYGELAFGPHRTGREVRPTVELVCGAGTMDHIARSPVAPLATAGLLSADEVAELRRLQDGVRTQLVAQGRSDLLDYVDSQAFLTAADLPGAGVVLDPGQVERLSTLMERSRYSGAVFYRPEGLPPV
jgi:hypothetical protein